MRWKYKGNLITMQQKQGSLKPDEQIQISQNQILKVHQKKKDKICSKCIGNALINLAYLIQCSHSWSADYAVWYTVTYAISNRTEILQHKCSQRMKIWVSSVDLIYLSMFRNAISAPTKLYDIPYRNKLVYSCPSLVYQQCISFFRYHSVISISAPSTQPESLRIFHEVGGVGVYSLSFFKSTTGELPLILHLFDDTRFGRQCKLVSDRCTLNKVVKSGTSSSSWPSKWASLIGTRHIGNPIIPSDRDLVFVTLIVSRWDREGIDALQMVFRRSSFCLETIKVPIPEIITSSIPSR